MVRPYQPFRNTQGRFCMAGYHCLMPNGIFPANPSPMSNGILSLLTAPCMLPNGIFFLSGCHCLMLIGIFPANLCPMPIGILFAGCPFVCCLLHLFVLMPLAFFFFNRVLLMCGSMQPHSGIGGTKKSLSTGWGTGSCFRSYTLVERL